MASGANAASSHSAPGGWGVAALDAASLTLLAFVHPLLDLLGRFPEFFVVSDASPGDIVLLAGSLCLALPLAVVFLVWSLFGFPRLFRIVHGFWIALCLAAISIQLFGGIIDRPEALVLVSLLAGVTGALLYRQVEPVRAAFHVTWLGLILIPAIFLARAPVWSAGGGANAETVKIGSRSPIIFVVFDELPLTTLLDANGEIDAVRFPNFAELSRSSYWFSNATTVSEGTLVSVPAMLDGRYPSPPFALPTLDGHPRNLFTMLAGSYHLNVHENITRLATVQRTSLFADRWSRMLPDLRVVAQHVLLPAAWTRDLPPITESWGNFQEGQDDAAHPTWGSFVAEWAERPRRFGDFLESIVPTDQPALHFLHSTLPHASWKFLPDGRTYSGYEAPGVRGIAEAGTESGGANVWLNDEWLVTQSLQRHVLQVGFVDTLVGQLLGRLRETNLFDRSLVVVTADHGAAFRPGLSRRRITEATAPEILSIPLFIKVPGQTTGVRSERNVETIDVLPTIVEVLGADLPWDFDGRSALTGADRTQKRAISDRGDEFQFPGVLPGLDEVRTRNRAQVGNGPWASVFRAGDPWGITGRPVEEFETASDQPELEVRLEGEELFRRVSARGAFVPALVQGTLTGPWPRDQSIALAVAVNRRIEAVTWTSPSLNQNESFQAIVPPESLREGANEVGVFRVVVKDGDLLLGAVARSGVAVTLVASELRDSKGKAIPIDQVGIPGWVVSGIDPESQLNWVGGWAVDQLSHKLVDEIVVFANGRLVARGPTRFVRPEGSAWLGLPEVRRAGFHFDFSLSEAPRESEVRVIAISEGRANELIYPQSNSGSWVFRDNPVRPAPPRPDALFTASTVLPGAEAEQGMFPSGWSIGEGTHRWTSALRAELVVPAPLSGTRLTVTLQLRPFLVPGKLDSQRLLVGSKSGSLEAWTLTEKDELKYEFELTPEMGNSDGKIVVDLELPDARSPRELGLSSDPRMLGVALTRIDLTPALLPSP